MADHKNVYARVGRMRSVTSVARSEYAPFMKPTSPLSPKGILLRFFRASRRKKCPNRRVGNRGVGHRDQD